VASMVNGTTQNFGPEPPTKEQMLAMVAELTLVCSHHQIPVGNLMTHAEAADCTDGAQGLDLYGPLHGCERWDFWVMIDPLTLELYPHGGGHPGCLYWPDWLRGEVIMELQKATEHLWKVTP